MTFTLYIARHGQTEANAAGRYPGHREWPLTALGRAQASDVGKILKREIGAASPIAFVSRPLGRAQATMRLVREELGFPPDDFAVDARLVDIDHGHWTGFTDEEVLARDADCHSRHYADKWNVPMTGGECYGDVARRAQSFLNELSVDTMTVSHGAMTQLLRGLSTGMDAAHILALEEPQGVVFRVRDTVIARLDPD